ncbi:11018_t:CDS:10 [Dentiscutata erythropus]|uniref:11018_t:CDS:1 n=1 Tax=Dentiscutata erythropus TaxID=1348616 RepID=A0A9N8WGA0_9GLOM|nr:11018_t:CDS:10 [Dentiscutata erythropus]
MDTQYSIQDNRINVLFDRASDSKKDQQLRIEALISFQQIVENEKHLLEPGLFQIICGFLKDSMFEIREWTIDFLEYAFTTCGLNRSLLKDSLGKILPAVGYTVSFEESTNIVKKAILWNAGVYPLIYERVCENAYDAEQLWSTSISIKSQIMRCFDSPGTKQGIKICAVKYLQSVIKVQSRHVHDSQMTPQNAQNDISLALCPSSHPILNPLMLEKEAIAIVNGLYNLFDKESSSVITAIINALGPIFRSRPQYIYPLIKIVKKWKHNPPDHLHETPFKSVKKAIKIQLTSLLRIPVFESSSFANEIFDSILILGGKNDPMKFPRQYRRLLQQKEGMEDGTRNPMQKVYGGSQRSAQGSSMLPIDPTQFALPFVVDIIHLALQSIPQERLNQAKQVLQQREARLAALRTLPTPPPTNKQERRSRKTLDPRLEFVRDVTPKSPSPPPVVMTEDEMMLIKTESSNSTQSEDSTIKREFSPPNLYDDDMEIDDVATVDIEVPQDQQMDRSDVVLTTLSNGKRMSKSQIHLMASRLLTRGLDTSPENSKKTYDELREMFIQYILEDFKNRTEFALTWFDEEWYHDSIILSEDPSYKPNYVTWLSRLLDRIMPTLEDRIFFTQFLLNVPELQEDIVDRIKIFLNDPDRTRSSAISTANKWFPDHPTIGPNIESFALQSIKQLRDESPPPLFDYHYHVGGVNDTAMNTAMIEDEDDQLKWNNNDVERHLDLFLSLCSKKSELFDQLLSIYVETPESMQILIRKNAPKMVETIGINGLLHLFHTFPEGAEDFVLKMLVLVNTAKSVITEKNLEGRFLFPIIAFFEKVIATLDATDKQRDIVKKVFLKILTPPSNGTAPMTPSELLVSLHQMDKAGISLKQSVEAIHICFLLPNVFNQQTLGTVLQQLFIQSELPTTFMRTVTLAVRAYHALGGFVNEMLSRHISQIWENEVLRKGFILYVTEFCLKVQPNNFRFLLQLPKEKILDILKQRDQTLSKALKKYIENLKPEQKRTIPQFLFDLLEIGT